MIKKLLVELVLPKSSRQEPGPIIQLKRLSSWFHQDIEYVRVLKSGTVFIYMVDGTKFKVKLDEIEEMIIMLD